LSNEEEYRQCEAENAEEKILHQEKTHGQKKLMKLLRSQAA